MDKIFKIGLLVLGFGYLAYLFGVGSNADTAHAQAYRQTGQYQVFTARTGIGGIGVIDTVNADLYIETAEGLDCKNLVRAGKRKLNKPYKP